MLNRLLQKLSGSSKSRKGNEKSTSSKEVAKKRIKFALVYDKIEVSDNLLKDLQQDIIEVISRYFEIDKNSLTLDIQRMDDLSALVMNTSIISARKD